MYAYTYIRMLSTGAGTDVITTTTTPKTRTRTVRGTERSAANRWKAVSCLLRRLALIMFVISSLVACLALLFIYAGPIFLVQLLVVILVAYLVAGGRFRWFYIALKTAPRDFMWVHILLWSNSFSYFLTIHRWPIVWISIHSKSSR